MCQLNVVRSFGIILDVLNHVFDAQDHHGQYDSLTPPISPTEPDSDVSTSTAAATSVNRPRLTSEHRRLVMRLAPLRQIEHTLTLRFRAPSAPLSPPRTPLSPTRSHQELYVSGYAWQRARRQDADHNEFGDEDEELSRVLCACQEDMVALWNDQYVRKLLKVQRVGMEELSSL